MRRRRREARRGSDAVAVGTGRAVDDPVRLDWERHFLHLAFFQRLMRAMELVWLALGDPEPEFVAVGADVDFVLAEDPRGQAETSWLLTHHVTFESDRPQSLATL